MALLDSAVRRYVDPAPAAHVLLGESVMFTNAADLVSYLAAAGEDPVVGWGGT